MGSILASVNVSLYTQDQFMYLVDFQNCGVFDELNNYKG